MKFQLSLHATEQASVRNISHELIFDTIENPDKIEEETDGQMVYQKSIKF